MLFALFGNGLVQAAEDGWRTYEAGDISFDAPASMQAPSVDHQEPPAANAGNPNWTFTLTDRPDRPDRGATITFDWSRDVTEQATGAQVLARSRQNVAYHQALRIDWRDAGMRWRGADTIIRDASPAGALFKVSCHSPEERWAVTAQLCDRIIASLSIVDGTDTDRGAAPQPDQAPPPAAAPPPPKEPDIVHKPDKDIPALPPSPKPEPATTAAPAPPPPAPTSASASAPKDEPGTYRHLGLAAAFGAILAAIGILFALRLRRKPATSQKAAAPAQSAHLRPAPCYCTECGARITHFGPCPNCGAAIEDDRPG